MKVYYNSESYLLILVVYAAIWWFHSIYLSFLGYNIFWYLCRFASANLQSSCSFCKSTKFLQLLQIYTVLAASANLQSSCSFCKFTQFLQLLQFYKFLAASANLHSSCSFCKSTKFLQLLQIYKVLAASANLQSFCSFFRFNKLLPGRHDETTSSL